MRLNYVVVVMMNEDVYVYNTTIWIYTPLSKEQNMTPHPKLNLKHDKNLSN